MAGTEQGLMIALSEIISFSITGNKKSQLKPVKRIPLDFTNQDFGPGSFNHKGLRCSVSLGMAYLYKEDIPAHEKRLLSFLKVQEERGHCCIARAIETLSGSHGQLNLAWAISSYLLVNRYGSVESEQLRIALRNWIWTEMILIQHCKLPNKYLSKNGYSPTFHTPGWRAMRGDQLTTGNSARDLCGRIILEYSYPKPGESLYLDKYNLGALALLRLTPDERVGLIPLVDWKPSLPYDYCIITDDGGRFIAGFRAPSDPDVCLVAGYIAKEDKLIVEPAKNIDDYDDVIGVYSATAWSQKNRPQRG